MKPMNIDLLDGIWRLEFEYQMAVARPPLEALIMLRHGVMAGLASAGVTVIGDISFRPNGTVEFQMIFDSTLADPSILLISRAGTAVRDKIQFTGVLNFDPQLRMLEGLFDHGVVPILTRGVFSGPLPG
ncbi:MAG: hypothetical protein ORO03_02730 [Alphaproteobacteria bacterium]|nr:hypothetical protein [Alphaproteobacteria bacterium]